MQIDAWRLKLPKMCSLWRNLVIFALFCMTVTKVSSFWPPTKNCNCQRKLTVFGQEWMQLDAWSLKRPKCIHFDKIWWFLHFFAWESPKLVHFGHLHNFALFWKNRLFLVRMDATRCLKAKTAKNAFTLTNIRDFCTILHDSPKLVRFGHLQKFALSSEKCSFSGRNWCRMGVRWLKTVY